MSDAWIESARRFFRRDEECECDCWLCQQQPPRHHEGCFPETEDVTDELAEVQP